MTSTSKTSTSKNGTSRAGRWIHRPHRRHWLADTRDVDYSAGRLMNGYGPRD